MKNLTHKNLHSVHSIFSRVDYKIDNNHQIIEIGQQSLLNTKTRNIPIDSINPEPLREQKLDTQRLVVALLSLAFGLMFTTYALVLETPLLNVYSGIFFIFSTMLLNQAIKNKQTTYTFLSNDTQTKLFSIVNNNSFIQVGGSENKFETFIYCLKSSINSTSQITKKNTYESKKEKYSFLINKLDEIYNFGVVNDTVYDIVESSIKAKIYEFESNNSPSRENVIAFDTKKKVMQLA